MQNLFLRFLLVAALAIGSIILLAPSAFAQSECAPVSGTVYGWFTDTWHGTGEFAVGRKVLHMKLLVVNTSFFDDGNLYRGTETWTFDFGKGDTIQAKTQFITEHMTDAASSSGVFHVTEVGQFGNGTGKFYGAYGSLTTTGPFGPSVKVPDNVKVPPDAQMIWYGPYQGMLCGMRN